MNYEKLKGQNRRQLSAIKLIIKYNCQFKSAKTYDSLDCSAVNEKKDRNKGKIETSEVLIGVFVMALYKYLVLDDAVGL